MKKILCFFLMFVLCIFPNKATALSLSAKYACVIDAVTGRVLVEKNAYSRHSMASTTKIMTALVAIKYSSPDDIVTVSSNAAGVEGSSIYLKSGEKIKMSDLLYGLMLASGNDAAVAIAEHVGGSIDGFSHLMNLEAKELGLKNTSFKNPNGLDADGHHTTAYDLAQITREAIKNPLFSKIVSTKNQELKSSDIGHSRYVTNHNKLLRMYSGCIGVKTGFTKKTGRCLVSAAEKENMRVIAVTLSAPDDWNDHTKMLDYAFQNNEAKPLVKTDMTVKTLPVISGDSDSLAIVPAEDYYILTQKGGGFKNIEVSYKLPDEIRAPVTEGDTLGTLTILQKGEVLKQIELKAKNSVCFVTPPKPKFWEIFYRFMTPFGG